jgi:hypothetical protein
MHEAPTAKSQTSPEAVKQAPKSETDAPSLEQPLSHGLLLHLQRTAGNTAVNALLSRRNTGRKDSAVEHAAGAPVQRLRSGAGSVIVQRHPVGEALPEAADLVSEVEAREAETASGGGGGGGSSDTNDTGDGGAGGSGQANTQDAGNSNSNDGDQDTQDGGGGQAPEATRSARQETTDTSDATAAGTAFKALTPGAMSLATAQKVLTGAFGGVKAIVPGSIVILADQPACSAKYDEVCMAAHIKRDDGSDWKAGDCAKDDAAAGVTTEGFAWGGIVYVNGKTTLVTATAHEILHNNTAADYRAAMGETFNEGSTEYLARKAVAAAGVTVPATTAYPTQVDITTALVALVGEDALISAYFGGAATLKDLITTKAKGTWAQIRAAAEGLQTATAKDLLKPKA